MIVIGLTGSIGMGKTTAANMLRVMGCPVHEADRAVHDILAGDGAATHAVAMTFPDAYDRKKNTIDRSKLRAALGDDPEKWQALEDILHPLVVASEMKFLRDAKNKGAKIAVLDIPLLFETGAETRLDYTICVTAPPFIQRQRVMSRQGMTEADFAFRLSRQMADVEKRARADFVVQTGLGRAHTGQALQKIVRSLRKSALTEPKR